MYNKKNPSFSVFRFCLLSWFSALIVLNSFKWNNDQTKIEGKKGFHMFHSKYQTFSNTFHLLYSVWNEPFYQGHQPDATYQFHYQSFGHFSNYLFFWVEEARRLSLLYIVITTQEKNSLCFIISPLILNQAFILLSASNFFMQHILKILYIDITHLVTIIRLCFSF